MGEVAKLQHGIESHQIRGLIHVNVDVLLQLEAYTRKWKIRVIDYKNVH